jgi:hypothetical protein
MYICIYIPGYATQLGQPVLKSHLTSGMSFLSFEEAFVVRRADVGEGDVVVVDVVVGGGGGEAVGFPEEQRIALSGFRSRQLPAVGCEPTDARERKKVCKK